MTLAMALLGVLLGEEARPERPARPVRPIRWMYETVVWEVVVDDGVDLEAHAARRARADEDPHLARMNFSTTWPAA